MYSEKMYQLGSKRSVIREIFEYGKKRAAEIGRENVFDFSIGNPNVPAPEVVKEALLEQLNRPDSTLVHGYTSAQGDQETRQAIADSLNKRFQTNFTADHLYMTLGAAASLSICFKLLTLPGDEYITFAPFFPEYTVFVEAAGGKLNVVPADLKDFQIDFDKFEGMINKNTKGVIINSPNNPSGVIYSVETVTKLADLLKKKSEEYGAPIYLIADEPYREIAYDGVEVPFLPNYYDNTFVCYSYSKSLSLPGERIGYVAVSPTMEEGDKIYAGVCGAGRALGYVCAPSLFQKAIVKCVEATSDISIYKKNRDVLYQGLTDLGFQCVKPQGAFYLFVKALEEDANKFCEKARDFDILLVAGDGFGCPGYVRISYCVQTETIVNSLKAFKKLADSYK